MTSDDRRVRLVIPALFVLLGAAVRWPGMTNPLWLDEIWSLHNVMMLGSWTGVFTELRTDNNHHLNSLWMLLLGGDASAAAYRLLSFATGSASMAMAFLVGKLESLWHARATAALFALSYLVVYYASEARGYSAVVFFTLAAWYCLQSFVMNPSSRTAAGFWMCTVGGVVSHQTYAEFFLAAALWADAALQRDGLRAPHRGQTMIRLFGPPAAFLAVFYALAVRGTTVAGGPPRRVVEVIGQTLSLLVSGPTSGGSMVVAAILTAGAVVASMVRLRRRGCDRWLMYLGAIVVLPAMFLVVQPSAPIYPRYFLVPGVFVLLALAELAGDGLRKQGTTRSIAAGSIAAMAVGAVTHLTELRSLGRGRYDEAVRLMMRDGNATVASTAAFTGHDFRVAMQLDYHQRRVDSAASLRYVAEDEYPVGGSGGLVRGGLIEAEAPVLVEVGYGSALLVVVLYPSNPLTGLSWTLYRRAEPFAHR